LLKILLTVHQFYPDYFSGTEVLTFSVAKELIRRGHTVAVLTGYPSTTEIDDADRYDEYDLEGMHVYRFHHAYTAMGGQDVVTEIEYDNHLATQYFVRILAQFKPDIVHFFHMIRLGARLIDAAVSAGIPAFYTPTDFWSICPTAQLLLPNGKVCGGPSFFAGNCVKHFAQFRGGSRAQKVAPHVPDIVADIIVGLVKHDILPPHPVSREIKAMSQRKAFVRARLNWLDGIVSPTRFMTKVITENGVDRRLVINSGYGIDVGGYTAAPPEIRPGEVLTIGFIGTLAPHKGCLVLIEAFKLLPRGAARLKIYGNLKDFAEYNASLRRRAEGFDAIEFCGTFPNGDISRVLEGLHVLVVPSLWFENSPLVVQSALAAKRPVIASNFPGLSDTIKDDWNGMTFRPGDFKALYARLERLISEPTLLARLSANCRPPKSTVEYVDELLALYKNSPRSALAPAEQRGAIAPDLEVLRKLGFLRGWAVIGFKKPARVTLRIGETVLGEVTEFYARPDVRERVQGDGGEVKSDAFGFTMRLPNGIDRRKAVLHCEDGHGRTISLPLLEVASGDTVQLDKGDYVSVGSEHLMWQVDFSGFLRGWAAVGYTTPLRVALRVGETTLGETTHFLARLDVQDSLKKENDAVNTDAFGFSILLPSGIDRDAATLYCEGYGGRMVILPLREITSGNTAHLGNGDFIALDSERLTRRAADPRS
jgi:glycosyltransferase involved in cell wall biosynthesis